MSYFTCDVGTKYYPFGRGGRENLLRGCASLQKSDAPSAVAGAGAGSPCTSPTAPAGPHAHAADGSCLGGGAAGVTDAVQSASSSSSDAYVRLQHCPLHSLPIYSPVAAPEDPAVAEGHSHDVSLLPVTITHPSSTSAQIYQDLAKDVIVEVFRNQISTMLVSLFWRTYDGVLSNVTDFLNYMHHVIGGHRFLQ